MKIQINCKFKESTATSLTGQQENKFDKLTLIERLQALGYYDIEVKKISSKRSLTINRALHLWFTQIVAHCSNMGHTMSTLIFRQGSDGIYREILTLTHGLAENTCDYIFKEMIPEMIKTELPITEVLLKDYFRAVGKYMNGKESTADYTNKEMVEVIEFCERVFAERLGYTEEFPNKEQVLLGKLKK